LLEKLKKNKKAVLKNYNYSILEDWIKIYR
jgi:hypothetical protein